MYTVLSGVAACGRLGVAAARPACLFGKRPEARDQYSTRRTLARRQQTESVEYY